MKFYNLEMNETEARFVIHAMTDMVEYLVDQIKDSEVDTKDEEQMSTDESARVLVSNVMANAQAEIEQLKVKLAERDALIEDLMSSTATSADAPYGLKKDGTPKKRPGRPSKKGKK